MRSFPFLGVDVPPLRGPGALLLWIGRHQVGIVLVTALLGVLGYACSALQPYLLGRVIDSVTTVGLNSTSASWMGLMLGLALIWLVVNVLGRRWDTWSSLRASLRTVHLLVRAMSGAGRQVVKDLPAGEVVSTVANDTSRIGEAFGVVAHVLGCLVTYAGVVLVMCSQSLLLGMVIALGLPVVAVALTLLVRPLQRDQHGQRDAQGRLTALGTDVVAGLRILRGVGGEPEFTGRYRRQSRTVRAAGEQVAGTQSLLDGLQVLLPGVFVCLVVYLGATEAAAGHITIGQLVSFYGYASSLAWPVHVLVQSVGTLSRTWVAATHVLKVLELAEGEARPDAVPPPQPGAPLVDEASGVEVTPGRSLAVVSADPDESARVAARLGGLDVADTRAASATWGGVRLTDLDPSTVRHRIVVAEATPTLFSGALLDELDVRGGADRSTLEAALEAADADDVLESVPGGIEGTLPEGGRSLSGGQRQRLALARALVTEPEVLILVDPTSAVDAHTEARIAQRLTRWRRGRTTVVMTSSPLVLDELDEVQFLEEGRVSARGSHRELSDRADGPDGAGAAARYRNVVSRSMDPRTVAFEGGAR